MLLDLCHQDFIFLLPVMLSPEFWYASKVFFFLFSPSFSLEIITRKRREKKQKNRKKLLMDTPKLR
jgi:hypothetical protein